MNRLPILLWLTLPRLALGQDPPAVDVAQVAPAGVAGLLAGAWHWAPAALPDVAVVDAVALPDAPASWVAVDERGEAWLTADGGATFRSVLGPGGATQETVDPRERLETQIRELFDQLQDAAQPDVAFDDDSQLAQFQAEIQALQEQLAALGEENAATRLDRLASQPRVWALGGAIYVGRADGLWRTGDRGATWTRIVDEPVRALAAGAAGWIAGTDAGILTSVDGLRWSDVVEGTEGVAVHDVAVTEDGAWAATGAGLWLSLDGIGWERRGTGTRLVRVLPDPEIPGAAWVASASGVLRTEDAGFTLRDPSVDPVGGVLSLAWIGPGHLLAAGDDGAWETVDGGGTWTPRTAGIGARKPHAVVVAGADLLLATDGGLLRLTPGALAAAAPTTPAPYVPLRSLLEASNRRRELNATPGSRWVATALPRLTVAANYVDATAIDWSLASGTTNGGVSGWGFTTSLTWTPRAQTSLDDALLQIDTDIILNNGAVGGAFAASSSRDMSTYKASTSRQIAELYSSRVDLSRATPAGLTDLVRRAIDIQELDARLDIFTDGAVSAWIAEPRGASRSEQP